MVNMFYKGKEACKEFLNNDLFELLFHYIESKNISITVKWMPSHLKLYPNKKRPDWVTESDIIVNDMADELADLSTLNRYGDMNIPLRVIKYTHLVGKIQSKLACIL